MGILRLILALSVVAAHSSNIFGVRLFDATQAVHIFFIISGFYMALILTRKYDYLPTFYINRFLRLWPTYIVVLLSTYAWFYFSWHYTGKMPLLYFYGDTRWVTDAYSEMPLWQSALLRLSNISMIGLDITDLFHYQEGRGFLLFHSDIFADVPGGMHWAGGFNAIGQAWSISSEIWFYMLAPFLVRRSTVFLTAIIAASLMIGSLMKARDLSTYFFFPAILYLFVIGILIYRLSEWIKSRIDLRPAAHVIFRWDATIGNLSYPIYMTHMLILEIVQASLHSRSGSIIAPITIMASAGLYMFIDKPIDAFRQRLATKDVLEKVHIGHASATVS